MRTKLIIQCFTVSFLLLVLGISDFAEPQNLDKPLPGRLRAGYMAGSNILMLERMSQIGMNAVIPKFSSLAVPLSLQDSIRLNKFADECKRLNMAFMPAFNFWDSNAASKITNFNHFVTESGRVLARTPCPYTKSFWDNYITPRILGIVNVALKDQPLDAFVIDLEMYGVERSDYDTNCYCDTCYARYMKTKGRTGKLPARADRGKIIKAANELGDYRAVQREAARSYATECRRAVQQVRPGLRLGVLKLDSAIPLQQGIALGFGTPDLPVFCLTEETYETGYTPYIASANKTFNELGAYVDLLVGIWQSRFPPYNIPEQLYYSAHNSYGYWIFTMESFEQPDYIPLTGTIEENWSAIQTANSELDKLEANQAYQTAFRIRPFITPPTWEGFVSHDLDRKSTAQAQNSPVARIRGKNWVYFHANKGDRIDFQVTRKQVGLYGSDVSVGLVSPNKTQLGYGLATMMQPFKISVLAPQAGVYGLAVQSGDNGAEITQASHPYAVATGYSNNGAWFITKVPPLFIAVDRTSTGPIQLAFRTENSAEAVLGRVFSQNGHELWSGIVNGTSIVNIYQPDGDYLQVRFEKLPNHALEDVWVKSVKGVMPFTTTDPAGLLY